MPIVGPRPDTGLRLSVARRGPADAGPPWRYAGEVATPEASHAVSATVTADGVVEVEVEGTSPGDRAERGGLTERTRLLLRAACKHAHDDGSPPPRRIVRWRPEG
jgi:hypothetical protein